MIDSATADWRKEPDEEAAEKSVAESALRGGARSFAPNCGWVIEPH